jgi:hypothetical protein
MSRTRTVVLLAVLGSGAVAYGTSVMLLRGAKRVLAESGCDDPPATPEVLWAAVDRLETLERLPWHSRDARDAREYALWRCLGAVEQACMHARWEAERRMWQAIRDERDARSAGIRHESDHRRSLPDADSAAITSWEREQEELISAWEREAEQMLDWRPYVAAETTSTCETWAPTIAALERRQHKPTCAVCE